MEGYDAGLGPALELLLQPGELLPLEGAHLRAGSLRVEDYHVEAADGPAVVARAVIVVGLTQQYPAEVAPPVDVADGGKHGPSQRLYPGDVLPGDLVAALRPVLGDVPRDDREGRLDVHLPGDVDYPLDLLAGVDPVPKHPPFWEEVEIREV